MPNSPSTQCLALVRMRIKIFALVATGLLVSVSCWSFETRSEAKVITAIYNQLLRHNPSPDTSAALCKDLRDGKTVKQIVSEVCKSDEFKHSVAQNTDSVEIALTKCFERVLARVPSSNDLNLLATQLKLHGWDGVVTALLESPEYDARFGNFTVPHLSDFEDEVVTYTPSSVPCRTWEYMDENGHCVEKPITSNPKPGQGSDTPSREDNEKLDQILDRLRWGNIVFNAPESMAYGETKTIQLLLDASKSISELEGLIHEEGLRVSDRIRISDKMEAQLTGDAFEITQIAPLTRPAIQPISRKQVTEWRWDIRAKRLSSQRLHLSLDVIFEFHGEQMQKSYRVFDRDIVVDVRGIHSAILLAEDNWQLTAAISTAVLAALGWIGRRFVKKRASEQGDHRQAQKRQRRRSS